MTAAFDTAPNAPANAAKRAPLPWNQRAQSGRTPRPVLDWAEVPAGLVAGDPEAIARTSAVIVGVLRRSRSFDQQALWEDIIQDVLTALIRVAQRRQIREPRAFVGYIATVTRHELGRRLHGVGAARARESATELESVPTQSRRDEDCDLRIDLQRALAALPEKQRRVVRAVYLEGRSYEDAAQTLHMPLGTLKRMQTQGLRALRDHMQIEG